jgi:DNA-binding PadR family transcriptional regulator
MSMLWSMESLTVLGLFGAGRKLHGYAVCEETGLKVSTVYRVLERFEENHLLHRDAERVNPHLSDRVPRIVYHLTTAGADQLNAIRSLVSA